MNLNLFGSFRRKDVKLGMNGRDVTGHAETRKSGLIGAGKKLFICGASAILSGFAALSAFAFNGAYYGTNYTVPFAHAYRTLDKLNVDHKQAIDRDVYHFSRLGLNAFRLHLWDVELTDANGNLLKNEHLDLLDYLIARLKERGIDIILTAQTNFGNGYPDKDTNPNGAYSYNFDKCSVHSDPLAVNAQDNYLRQLVNHVNPYTGLSLAADPSIIAMEINNEPCHSGTHQEITGYVNRMADALKSSGWKKDILYNVSHNLWYTSAFYAADVNGVTFQWYPTGLVHGQERKGNFLPNVDSYDIPFDHMPGSKNKQKVVYEFDPADQLSTYLYPAMARSFRKAGFDWMTQFAYDPIDMAQFNSEYPTHFLNLAYTPGKAVSMAIAAEVAKRMPKGKDYGVYPKDTVFGDFLVSSRRNLAMLNDGENYYHTNATEDLPKRFKNLRRIIGVGNSPMVYTDGTGAYFLDRLPSGVWRLEVMPDVVITTDPFRTTELDKPVAEIINAPVTMVISLPGLGGGFYYSKAGERNFDYASGGELSVAPGVYLLSHSKEAISNVDINASYGDGHRRINEYVSPKYTEVKPFLVHEAQKRVDLGSKLDIRVKAYRPEGIDSVVMVPMGNAADGSLLKSVKMKRISKYDYMAKVDSIGNKPGSYNYKFVVYGPEGSYYYPGGEKGNPSNWEFKLGPEFVTEVAAKSDPVVLFLTDRSLDGTEISNVPDTWKGLSYSFVRREPLNRDAMRISKVSYDKSSPTVSKYVGDITWTLPEKEKDGKLMVRFGNVQGVDKVKVGVVDKDGFTFTSDAPVVSDGVIELDIKNLRLDRTLLTPSPYPSFMKSEFVPTVSKKSVKSLHDIDRVQITVPETSHPVELDLNAVWIERRK